MRIIAALGVEIVVLTNAAGGIHRDLTAGSFMILRDHINLQGVNPLTGPELEGQSRFVDMTSVYDLELRRMLRRAAKTVRVTAREGVYLAVAGPSYETPAEVRAFHRLGADAVGMSTVAEAIVARQCGLRVAGLSLITNKAAGLSCGALSHDDVLARGRTASAAVGRWINEFIRLSTSAADLPSVRAGKSRLPAQG
jgi:inosine/guanosine/xanthosine phosphorylase family protein